MAKKSKYRTVSIPRGVTKLIEELMEELGLWSSVSAFARDACLDKIQEEKRKLKELKEDQGLMAIKVGLDSTKILLTDIGKKWFLETYPKGIVYEYNEDVIFKLDSMLVVEKQPIARIICPLGIPYQIICEIDGQTTFRMVDKEEEKQG